jgi:hypothetical protein
MPYLGRAPTGTGSVTEIDGDLKITGQLTAQDTLFKMILDGTDGSSTNASDNIIIEDGGTDGSGTDAGDDICTEKDTGNKVDGGNIVDLTGVTIDSTANVTGKVIQISTNQTAAHATSTSATPHDNTIPQSNEGLEVLTLAFTPTSSSNKLIITANIMHGDPTGANMALALFQDSGTDAIAATSQNNPNMATGSLIHVMTAGTTSETTFKLRIGPSSSHNYYLNGTSAQHFSTAAASTIIIQEIST